MASRDKELSLAYEEALLNYRKLKKQENVSAAEVLQRRMELLSVVQASSDLAFLHQTERDLEEDFIRHHLESMESLLPVIERRRTKLPPVEVDVNEFFRAYPECMQHLNCEDDGAMSFSESDDDEVVVLDHKPKRKKENQTNSVENSPSAVATATIVNPYAKQQQEVAAPTRKHDGNTTRDESFQKASSWTMPSDPSKSQHRHSNTIYNQQTWEDHARVQNPFQTAREYVNAQQHSTAHNHHHHHEEEAQLATKNSNNNHASTGPAIRDSLRRKYQMPKRIGEGEKTDRNTNNSASANLPPPRKRGLAGGARPNVAKATAPPPPRESSKEDDDDLPEELKRFGKELVEKIENEIMDCGEPVTFHDIAGLEDAKQTVQEVVCWPMKRPDLFTGLRRAPNGLLLYGPPGTGKTLIGKAIAHESGATFFSISSSSLTSKWIGEGEKLVRVMFAVAALREPAVVFIDEIDSLLTQRKSDENEASRRIKTEFLVQLDGTGTSGQGRVLVIGATNRPQELDEAARRRFTKRLYIPLPEENDREVLLRVLLEKNNHRLVDAEIKKLAKDSDGYSGADLKALSTDAAMGPIRELGTKALDVEISDVPPISYKHFRRALKGMKPSVAPADLHQYIEWDKTYGTRRAELDGDDDDDDVAADNM